jgi:glycerol-1-phosphate dehydrogenase [NAD(P)+]
MKGKNKEIILQYWKEIKEIYRDLPDQNLLRTWLGKVGEAATPEELGISKELIEKALDNAHLLRDRYTGLKLYNEQQLKLKNESILSTRRPNEVK